MTLNAEHALALGTGGSAGGMCQPPEWPSQHRHMEAASAGVADACYSDPDGAMKEAEARRLLRRCDDPSGLEAWIVDQPWEAVAGGWRVIPDLEGWRFRLEPVPGGLRVSAAMSGALPAVWTVTTPRP